jgi:hypothetical protein
MNISFFPLEKCLEFLRKAIEKGLLKRPIKEIIMWIRMHGGNPAYFQKKKNQGIEYGLDYRNVTNTVMYTCWTTYSEKLEGLKEHDEGWDLILVAEAPEPFFFFPQRRTKTYFDRKLERIDIAIDLVQHWPTCPVCGKPLIPVRNEEMYRSGKECFHMRWLTCRDEALDNHGGNSPYYRIVDMPGINERNRKKFKKMFDTYHKYEQAYFNKHGEYPIPKRFIRWCAIHGIPIPKDIVLSCRPEFTTFTDLKHESVCDQYSDLSQEKRLSEYNDLQYEER